MEKEKQSPPKRRAPFFRNMFIMIHLVGFYLYLSTQSTYFYQSYISDRPIYFVIMTILFFAFIYFYSQACQGAGYQTEEPEKTEGLFFSEDAGMHLQVRACYCRECKKVILRRDHHCPWTSHCIGRDNNVVFFYFTIIETIFCTIALIDLTQALYYSILDNTFLRFLLPWLYSVAACIFGIYATFSVSLQTITCIQTNTTVWEYKCHDRITYLNKYPPWYSPFNNGLWENIVEFFTMKKKKLTWDVPTKIPSLQDLRMPDNVKEQLHELKKQTGAKNPFVKKAPLKLAPDSMIYV